MPAHFQNNDGATRGDRALCAAQRVQFSALNVELDQIDITQHEFINRQDWHEASTVIDPVRSGVGWYPTIEMTKLSAPTAKSRRKRPDIFKWRIVNKTPKQHRVRFERPDLLKMRGQGMRPKTAIAARLNAGPARRTQVDDRWNFRQLSLDGRIGFSVDDRPEKTFPVAE